MQGTQDNGKISSRKLMFFTTDQLFHEKVNVLYHWPAIPKAQFLAFVQVQAYWNLLTPPLRLSPKLDRC